MSSDEIFKLHKLNNKNKTNNKIKIKKTKNTDKKDKKDKKNKTKIIDTIDTISTIDNTQDIVDNTNDDNLLVDFSDCLEIVVNTKKNLYEKNYDETTTKFYRTLRENKINAIMQDNSGFYPEKSFMFFDQWDPYTGTRTNKDPYGPLYFHPDDLIRYFYTKRLNMLWIDQKNENHGHYIQGYYGDAVGSGEDILITGRGIYPESYLFRLPIFDCYLENDSDMSLITMGPKLTNEELQKIDEIAENIYKNNYQVLYKKKRPSLAKMKEYYDQAISTEPIISNVPEYVALKDKKLTDEKLIEFRNKANRIAVESLKKM